MQWGKISLQGKIEPRVEIFPQVNKRGGPGLKRSPIIGKRDSPYIRQVRVGVENGVLMLENGVLILENGV